MRSESSEKRLVTIRRTMHGATESNAAQTARVEENDAVDLAFEDYTRVDVGVVRDSATHNPHQVTKSLITDISAQLHALDQKRQKLADLLRDVSL